MTAELITIASIREVIQLREKLSQRTIDEYAEVYREAHRTKKNIMPPITVFRTEEIREGKDCARSIAVNIVGDGAHRLEGVRLAGLKTIEADVRFGTREDAILYGLVSRIRG